jgi:hypothetical protein
MGICAVGLTVSLRPGVTLSQARQYKIMDEFRKKIEATTHENRLEVLRNVVGFLRQNNHHQIADAFYDVLACYPDIPLSKEQREFRLFLAWTRLDDFENNRLVRQIIGQVI